MTSRSPADERVFRQPGGRVLALMLLGLGALCADNAVLSPGGSSSWDRIADAVLAVLLVVTVPAQWGAGVTVTPAGVSGRLQLGRRDVHLAWPEVHHFEMHGYWKGLCVVTTQGRVRSVMLMGFRTGGIDEVLHQLEDYRWRQQLALGLVR